jgi:hypothetical protein
MHHFHPQLRYSIASTSLCMAHARGELLLAPRSQLLLASTKSTCQFQCTTDWVSLHMVDKIKCIFILFYKANSPKSRKKIPEIESTISAFHLVGIWVRWFDVFSDGDIDLLCQGCRASCGLHGRSVVGSNLRFPRRWWRVKIQDLESLRCDPGPWATIDGFILTFGIGVYWCLLRLFSKPLGDEASSDPICAQQLYRQRWSVIGISDRVGKHMT